MEGELLVRIAVKLQVMTLDPNLQPGPCRSLWYQCPRLEPPGPSTRPLSRLGRSRMGCPSSTPGGQDPCESWCTSRAQCGASGGSAHGSQV